MFKQLADNTYFIAICNLAFIIITTTTAVTAAAATTTTTTTSIIISLFKMELINGTNVWHCQLVNK